VGFIYYNFEYYYAETANPGTFSGYNPYNPTVYHSDDFDKNSLNFSLSITPEIIYFLKEKFALSLAFGIMEFGFTDEFETNYWIASVKPAYWSLGCKFKL